MAHHARASRTGAGLSDLLGSPGNHTVGSNFFGAGAYRNSGYRYGNGRFGFDGGDGYRHSRYVRAYVPGDGWVLVPIRAIRHI
jgi:hypothetical protein